MASYPQFQIQNGNTTLSLRHVNQYQALEQARVHSLRSRHLVALIRIQDGEKATVQTFLFGKPQRDKTPPAVTAAVAKDEFLHRNTGTTHAIEKSAPRPLWAHTKPRHASF